MNKISNSKIRNAMNLRFMYITLRICSVLFLSFPAVLYAQSNDSYTSLCADLPANTAASINFSWNSCEFNNAVLKERWVEVGLEIYPDQAPEGTYFSMFQIPGWYLGLQRRGKGETDIVIFSVWCSKEDDHDCADEKIKGNVDYDKAKASYFSFKNEGTGGQIKVHSDANIPFEEQQWYSFKAKLNHADKELSAFWKKSSEDESKWIRIGKFSLEENSDVLSSSGRMNSFIEDFQRAAPIEARGAYYRNAYIKKGDTDESKTQCDGLFEIIPKVDNAICETDWVKKSKIIEAKGAIYTECFDCANKSDSDGQVSYVVTGNKVLSGVWRAENIAPSSCSTTCPALPIQPITTAAEIGVQPSIAEPDIPTTLKIDLPGRWSLTEVIVFSDWWQKRPKKIAVKDPEKNTTLATSSFLNWEDHNNICGKQGNKKCEFPKNPTSHLRIPIAPNLLQTSSIVVTVEGLLSAPNKFVIIKGVKVLGRKVSD